MTDSMKDLNELQNDVFAFNIPVAFMVFNRPDTTKEVFDMIRRVKPPKLYLVSDAAREGKPGEEEKVEETRRYVEEHIDWECELHKNYAEKNMGCKKRMASGISWVFENEEMAVIIEDDCVPNMDFFRFQQEMLMHYKDDERVMLVSGTKNVPGYKIDGSYTFSHFASIWGWGSYSRAWKYYDVNMAAWPEIKTSGSLKNLFSPIQYKTFCRDADRTHAGMVDTWDFQWLLTVLSKKGVGVVPAENLVHNIGCGREDATHTKDSFREIEEVGRVTYPIVFRNDVSTDKKHDERYCAMYYGRDRIVNYIKNKIF